TEQRKIANAWKTPWLGGLERRSAAELSFLGFQRDDYMVRYEVADIAVKQGDFTNQRAGNERKVFRRRQEYGFQLRRQLPVHVGQLEFVFEIAHCAQPTQQDVGVLVTAEVGQQAAETDHG